MPEDDNYDEVEKFEQEALGIHEKLEGLHDDYYISAMIAVHDLNGVRAPERLKAGKWTINGVSLARSRRPSRTAGRSSRSAPKRLVAAIRKAIAAS